MIPLTGFTDPPPPPEGQTLEIQRDPFLGFITHYRHTEIAMQEKIGTDHIGHGSIQGTEEERRAMLRVMGAGMVDTHPDTQEVERLRAESEGAMMIIAQERAENRALQSRVAELEAELAALAAHDARRKP